MKYLAQKQDIKLFDNNIIEIYKIIMIKMFFVKIDI